MESIENLYIIGPGPSSSHTIGPNHVKRFHQVSTDEVYGPNLGQPFLENTPLQPTNPYSNSKAIGDVKLINEFKQNSFPMTITRSSNNFGPNQFIDKLIPLVIYNALNNKSIPIYGDGNYYRDWIFVDDHCKAIDLVLRFGTLGNIYNVSTNNIKSNLEIVRYILNKLSKPESLMVNIADRKNHENFNAAAGLVEIEGVSIHPGSAKGIMQNASTIACEYQNLLPKDEVPEKTDGYQGFIMLENVKSNIDKATLNYIIRDFSKELLNEKIALMKEAGEKIQKLHPTAKITVKIQDSYRNMGDYFIVHPEAIEMINKAYLASQLKLSYEPIRGGTDGAMITYMYKRC